MVHLWACTGLAGHAASWQEHLALVPLLSTCGRLESELESDESERIFPIFGLCPGYMRKCKSNPSNPSLPMGRCSHSLRWHTSPPRECELHQKDSLERRQSSEKSTVGRFILPVVSIIVACLDFCTADMRPKRNQRSQHNASLGIVVVMLYPHEA